MYLMWGLQYSHFASDNFCDAKKWQVLLCIPLEEAFQVMVNYVSIIIRTGECYKGWWKPHVETRPLWWVLQTSWPVAGWSVSGGHVAGEPHECQDRATVKLVPKWQSVELKRSPTGDARASLPKLPRLFLQNIFGRTLFYQRHVMEGQNEPVVKVGESCTVCWMAYENNSVS